MMHRYHFAAIDSTQQYLLDHPPAACPILCRAEMQTAGRGQRGAQWHSPAGGLYFSLRVSFPHPPMLMAGLAQATALVIAEYLDPSAQTISLKWPNDLFIGGKKLGGILIDIVPQADACAAVVGVGINLTAESDSTAALQTYFPKNPNLYAELTAALLVRYQDWAVKPYLAAAHRWDDYDRFFGQTIQLENRAERVQNYGIDQKGRLAIGSADGVEFLASARIQIS